MSLTTAERNLASAIAFDESVCESVKRLTGGTLERLLGYNDDFQSFPAVGLSVTGESDRVHAAISSLRAELESQGYRIYWSQRYDSDGSRSLDEIVVVKDTEPLAIVRLRKTSGANYDISHDRLISKLIEWQSACQVSVYGAAADWVALQFGSLPADLRAFAEDIYEICPDTVEQGVGVRREADEPAAFAEARTFYPQLSAKLEKRLRERHARLLGMGIPPEARSKLPTLEALMESTRDGIGLLARELGLTNQLYLWWD